MPGGCVMSEWSDWSACSKTCGNDGIQQQERRYISSDPDVTCGGGVRLRRCVCSQLPPCAGVLRTHSRVGQLSLL